MNIYEGLKQRRSYYQLNKELPVSTDEVHALIDEVTELVPDVQHEECARGRCAR